MAKKLTGGKTEGGTLRNDLDLKRGGKRWILQHGVNMPEGIPPMPQCLRVRVQSPHNVRKTERLKTLKTKRKFGS